MADFRKCVPVLAILALILGLTATAGAQPLGFSCVANSAVPQQLRFEGLTELVGDLYIECKGGVPTPNGMPIPQANITVFMGNTTVTSRLLVGNVSEAVLMLDEPTPAGATVSPAVTTNNAQVLCLSSTGCTGYGDGQGGFGPTVSGVPTFNTGYYGATSTVAPYPHPNMFEGLIFTSQPNAVTWLGVPIDPPGTNGTRVIRMTNIRINANALGVGTLTSPPVQAQAFISVSPSTSLPITNNASQVVGYVQRGLTFTAGTASSYAQCSIGMACSTSAIASRASAVSLKYSENFASAFKRRSIAPYVDASTSPTPMLQNFPGVLYGTETGFYAQATGPVAGLADFGTRLKAVFNNIPTGVTIYVDPLNTDYIPSLNVARLTSTESGVFTAIGTVGTRYALPLVTSGTVQTGSAVWEVLGEVQQAFNTMTFGVYACYTANAAGLGTATVTGSFAPTSSDATASLTAPIPRFVPTGTPSNIFTINVCATNLLFPFVTNQIGYDTGLAIANTSMDPFGTANQKGVCKLYSYGANAPAMVTSPVVDAGTVWTALSSASMPNFQGYVIARCEFQYAHGFAFVSDLGARNLAMGYLALVIPDYSATRSADPLSISPANSGEQLGQ